MYYLASVAFLAGALGGAVVLLLAPKCIRKGHCSQSLDQSGRPFHGPVSGVGSTGSSCRCSCHHAGSVLSAMSSTFLLRVGTWLDNCVDDGMGKHSVHKMVLNKIDCLFDTEGARMSQRWSSKSSLTLDRGSMVDLNV